MATKNQLYGDSVTKTKKILSILYPARVYEHQYSDLLLVVRVLDKLCRISERKDAYGENPWEDLAGYGILGVVADGRDDDE